MNTINKQQGLALYVALVMLISIAIVGVASSRSYINSVTSSQNLEMKLLADNASNSVLASSMDLFLADATGEKQLLNRALGGAAIVCYDEDNDPMMVDDASECKPLHWRDVNTKTSVAVNTARTVTSYAGNCRNQEGNAANFQGLVISSLYFTTTSIGDIRNSRNVQEQLWSVPGPPPDPTSCVK